MTDNEQSRQTLQEIACYFSNCYMNASHGQAQVKFQRYIDTVKDAIELLKEQEAKPVLSERECETLPNHYERKGFCPNCHQVVEWYLNRSYCGFCGQAVKWDG